MQFQWYKWCLLGVLLGFLGCSDIKSAAAPIGDKAVLEQLAQSYSEISKSLSLPPDRLPEKERKEFTVKVFEQAGYSYTATLKALVSGDYDSKQPMVRDMIELVTLPHRYLRWDDRVLQRLYTTEELGYIKRLQRLQ